MCNYHANAPEHVQLLQRSVGTPRCVEATRPSTVRESGCQPGLQHQQTRSDVSMVRRRAQCVRPMLAGSAYPNSHCCWLVCAADPKRLCRRCSTAAGPSSPPSHLAMGRAPNSISSLWNLTRWPMPCGRAALQRVRTAARTGYQSRCGCLHIDHQIVLHNCTGPQHPSKLAVLHDRCQCRC